MNHDHKQSTQRLLDTSALTISSSELDVIPVVQYATRREAREAQAARLAAAVAAAAGSELAVVASVSVAVEVHSEVAVREASSALETKAPQTEQLPVLSVPLAEIAQIPSTAVAIQPAAETIVALTSSSSSAATVTSVPVALSVSTSTPRRFGRGARPAPAPRAAAAPSAPAKPHRKNPLSVLATMAIVGGLFAVAGLPAYAMSTPEETPLAASNVAAQSLTVTADAASSAPARDGYTATTPGQLDQMANDALRAAQNAAYNASGARELGDDYPWPYELRDYEGGGMSPLNYYYRECVDFVAWRLNRDAGSYSAPFKYVWSNLTPMGGNGGQWMYNWQSLGRTVSNVPIAGAVAYTGGNHVAYVNSVNADGTVNLEEYNYIPGAYSQRTIPASSVVAFLYPPG